LNHEGAKARRGRWELAVDGHGFWEGLAGIIFVDIYWCGKDYSERRRWDFWFGGAAL